MGGRDGGGRVSRGERIYATSEARRGLHDDDRANQIRASPNNSKYDGDFCGGVSRLTFFAGPCSAVLYSQILDDNGI